MANLTNCTQCNEQYDWMISTNEQLVGDLNFCSNDCANVWLALAERKYGDYSCMTKEQCDEILKNHV